MANLTENDNWPDGIYQIEEDDPVLGGPTGITNVPPGQLAARTRFQRLRNITPWSDALPYPVNAFVSHGGATWKSVEASTGIAPGLDDNKWIRWGHTAAEMDALLPGRLINKRVFNAPGASTYTATPGTKSVVVQVVGGGGGSGGVAATGVSTPAVGGGGAAGSYGMGRYSAGFDGATVTVGMGGTAGNSSGVAGAGSASSCGALLTAPGGGGGSAGSATAVPIVSGTGGLPAAAPTGANICAKSGAPGGFGFMLATSSGVSGRGGDSPFGTSGASAYISTGGLGETGFGHGGGASGSANAVNQAAKNGAAGQAGLVIIWEYA